MRRTTSSTLTMDDIASVTPYAEDTSNVVGEDDAPRPWREDSVDEVIVMGMGAGTIEADEYEQQVIVASNWVLGNAVPFSHRSTSGYSQGYTLLGATGEFSFYFLVRGLRQHYTFRNEEEVESFLRDSPFLITLLEEACEQLDSHLPAQEKFLDVVIDPDTGNPELMVLCVLTNMSEEEEWEAFDHFDDEWWLDNVYRAENRLCIKPEYT